MNIRTEVEVNRFSVFHERTNSLGCGDGCGGGGGGGTVVVSSVSE